MWANRLACRSGPPFMRPSSQHLAGALSGVDTSSVSRRFSDDNRGGRGGRGGGGRGGGGRGGGGRGGNSNRSKDPGYNKKFLDPAARGQLKNHQSTIPKLAGRKSKGHSVRDAADFADDDEFDFESDENMNMQDFDRQPASKTTTLGSIAENSPPDQLSVDEYEVVQRFMKQYQAISQADEEEKYYWNELNFDDAKEAEKAMLFEKLREEATRDADGNFVVEVNDETFAMFDGIDPDAEESTEVEEKKPETAPRGQFSPGDHQAFQFVMEAMGVKDADKPHPPGYDKVLPLQLQGPSMHDFVKAMMEHPAKYGEVRWEAPNPGLDREPVPDFPPSRRNPPLEFVESNKRFLYIWGLPHLTADLQDADIDNPVQALEIQNLVAGLFDVDAEDVSVASATSAFVGFSSLEDFRFAAAVGPRRAFVEASVQITKFTPEDDFPLAKDHSDSLVLLQNLPHGLTPNGLSASLFPSDSDVGEVYGNLSPDRIVKLSPTSAVLAMDSAEMAENAITSSLVEERLAEIGQHPVRFAKARRELVFTGTHGGPDNTDRVRKQGPRLIVDGDMPNKAFYLSHAGTLFLRNLDPEVTKEDFTKLFQPYCSVPRDVEGSVEFVTCREGLPTGKAYVGFDEVGEMEAAMEALVESGGRLSGLAGQVIAKRVRDLDPKTAPSPRPSRSEEDLLDSLNNWEQFVDPADLEELMDHGISKEALTEAFRTIRHNNSTFSSMDQAMRNETLNPEHDMGGMYKELVQQYVSTLKECMSTPDDPGPIYESLFFPDEEIDTELFDREADRLEELKKRREAPWKN